MQVPTVRRRFARIITATMVFVPLLMENPAAHAIQLILGLGVM